MHQGLPLLFRFLSPYSSAALSVLFWSRHQKKTPWLLYCTVPHLN